ncbi:MAG TPA: S8 family serine peptidase [Gemmatimonadales bacterium]|nr:S8 family serine peptidase [Gemmatimonadales bacterium]
MATIFDSERVWRRTGFLAFLLGLAACERGMGPHDDPSLAAASPVLSQTSAVTVAAPVRTIPGQFIVTLAPKANPGDVARAHGVTPSQTYTLTMNGFAGSISEAARAGLLRDSRIVRIDPDRVVAEADGGSEAAASWGLDRIDQRSAALDGSFQYAGTGHGVTAYILDTGIRFSHSDFGGRARAGFDAFGGDGSDCRGHGTHVAATAGGSAHGVAKEVSLVSVRVLDCSGQGTTSGVVAGLEWVMAHGSRPAVANLSLSGDADEVLDAAVRATVAAGIPVVVAAGNNARDACSYSPARVPEAMTTGATDPTDVKPYFSNWGTCVDWYAPGVSIVSAGIDSDTDIATMSGTSMAAPHSTGVVALHLEAHPAATPAEVRTALSTAATTGVVMWQVSIGDLLFSGSSAQVTPPSDSISAPTAEEPARRGKKVGRRK